MNMSSIFENLVANGWNRFVRLFRRKLTGGLTLGQLVIDGRAGKRKYFLPHVKRAEHMVVLGKTGQGKSSLIFSLCLQDIQTRRGFVLFSFHEDLIPRILSAIAAEEQRTVADLSDRLILIEPGNPVCSVGLNPLAIHGEQQKFVSIAGIASILKERWGLTHFGPQTEEILRNSLHLLADNHLTLLELSPLLSDSGFRAKCLKQATNPEVKQYFESRFEPMSEAMKAVVRNPILNKVSEFCSDPHVRHIVGQAEPTFSFVEAMDEGRIILVDLHKGLLGKHSATLGSLVLAQIGSAIFRRRKRDIYSLYCDEIQNLLTSESEIDSLLAEARKFGVSIVTANQFLDQFPREMRAATQAVGTHIAFQLSSDDAQQLAQVLDGGK